MKGGMNGSACTVPVPYIAMAARSAVRVQLYGNSNTSTADQYSCTWYFINGRSASVGARGEYCLVSITCKNDDAEFSAGAFRALKKVKSSDNDSLP